VSDEEKQFKVTDSLKELYTELDKHTETALTRFKTTCKKGCTSCCYLLATVSFTEALLIAETILAKPDWRDMLPKLRSAAQKTDHVGITRGSYFIKANPCVFLSDDRTCSIYSIRPACCRFHYVASPPENCSYLAPPTVKTMALDLRALEEHVWGLSMQVVQQLGIPELIVGPMALMVLACMRYITVPGDNEHEHIVKACEGIRSPYQWMMECGRTLREDESEVPVRIPLEALKP